MVGTRTRWSSTASLIAASKEWRTLEALLWFVVLVVLLVVAYIVICRIRSSLGHEESKPSDALFDLDELRRLRDSGKLTIAEYEALKQKTIDETRGSLGIGGE